MKSNISKLSNQTGGRAMTDNTQEIELVIDRENNQVIIDGNPYPPTVHNLSVWRQYKATGDYDVLKNLSNVILDF